MGDSGYSRRIFWGVSSFQALAMFRRGLFYSYLSIYLRYYLGLNVTETTLFATLPMILNVVFQTFVWGNLSDRLQLRRTLIIRGELLAGIGTVLIWYVHTLTEDRALAGYIIIIGLSLIEIFWSMSNVGWSALISDIYRQEDRNAVQGRLISIGGLGRIGGVWIGGLLYDGLGRYYEGWGFQEGSLFFVASAAMFISIIPMMFVPEGGIGGQEETGTAADPGMDAAASDRIFVIFLIAMGLINFGRNSVAVIVSQYLVLETGFGVSSSTLSYIVNMQSLAIIFWGIGVGWLGRRIGNGRTLCLGAGLGMAGLAIFAAGSDLGLIYLGSFFLGASHAVVYASSYAFAAALIPPRIRAKRFGIFNATFFLSWGLAGTVIAGPITDVAIAFGYAEMFAYRLAFASAFVLTGLGLALQLVLIGMIIPKIPGKPVLT